MVTSNAEKSCAAPGFRSSAGRIRNSTIQSYAAHRADNVRRGMLHIGHTLNLPRISGTREMPDQKPLRICPGFMPWQEAPCQLYPLPLHEFVRPAWSAIGGWRNLLARLVLGSGRLPQGHNRDGHNRELQRATPRRCGNALDMACRQIQSAIRIAPSEAG